MRGRAYSKNALREVGGSLGRFLAILAITALGVGFFVGLRVSKPAMLLTGNDYISKVNMYDWRTLSTLGWTDADVAAAQALGYVEQAEGFVTADFMCDELDGGVLEAMTLTEKIDKPNLLAGRMPEAANECLADAFRFSKSDLGKTLTLSSENTGDTFDAFAYGSYTIVGICDSALYLSYERGTSSVGNGTVLGFLCIPAAGFSAEYYTELHLTLSDVSGDIYSAQYDDGVAAREDALTAFFKQHADARYHELYDEPAAELADAEQELADGWADYNEGRETADRELADALQELEDGEQKLADTKQQLSAASEKLAGNLRTVNGYIASLEATLSGAGIPVSDQATMQAQADGALAAGYLDAATHAQLSGAIAQLFTLYGQRSQIEAGQEQVQQGWYSYNTGMAELQQGREDYETARAETEQELADALADLTEGEEKLADAKEKLAKVTYPKVYVLDRSSTLGYATLGSDTDIVQGVSKVFPIFFFAVAALVCSTTMTRMVEEQRTQIGVFKALGYSRGRIEAKYLLYAGAASLLGWAAGFAGGSWLFPTVIWKGYSIMYYFSDTVRIVWDWALGAVSLAVSLICSLGATYSACRAALGEAPAQLLRPKAPAAGGRLLLERVRFLWERLSFLAKVSVRNIVRYKKRLAMMVLGVGGCTALLLTGYGIKDSVQGIVDYQFDEISLYDISVGFLDGLDAAGEAAFLEESGLAASEVRFLHQSNVDISANGAAQSAYFTVCGGDLDGFIDLHSGEQPVAWPGEGEAVICINLANALYLKIGDSFTMLDGDGRGLTLTVSGICDNYVYNYFYVDTASCAAQWGEAPAVKTALVRAAEGEDVHTLGALLASCDGVASVSVNNDLREMVDAMLKSLDYIVALVIACAAALVFIVLYNLTNINITEREREIATLKVLGFRPGETAQYVFRENLILSVAGALIGLPLGRLLHWYVMQQIQINMMHFPVRVAGTSHLYAFLLTIVFSLLVDFALLFRLKKINMAESLKSIE